APDGRQVRQRLEQVRPGELAPRLTVRACALRDTSGDDGRDGDGARFDLETKWVRDDRDLAESVEKTRHVGGAAIVGPCQQAQTTRRDPVAPVAPRQEKR